MSNSDVDIRKNRLLALVSDATYNRLQPHFEVVSLPAGRILYEPGEAIQEMFFPCGAMISFVSTMENGSTTEIGMVGYEGMTGLPAIWGGKSSTSRAIVQVGGDAIAIDAKTIKEEFARGEDLQRILLLYMQAFLTQVSQTAACNRQHATEERLSRWLLSARDCVHRSELPLTQEFVANMLGIRRPSVTVAAGMLQQAGVIRYARGNIVILDVATLENCACECYAIVKAEYERLLGRASEG
ncbi:MAG: Crp/Fnr family transcriptional regulator [Cyanobacteria bacterium J06639_1]